MTETCKNRLSVSALLATMTLCTACADRDTSPDGDTSLLSDAMVSDESLKVDGATEGDAGPGARPDARETGDASYSAPGSCVMKVAGRDSTLEPASWVRTSDPFPDQLSIVCGDLEDTALAFGVAITAQEPAEGTFLCTHNNLKVVQTEVSGSEVRAWEANGDVGTCTLTIAQNGERIEGTFDLVLESEADGQLQISEGRVSALAQ